MISLLVRTGLLSKTSLAYSTGHTVMEDCVTELFHIREGACKREGKEKAGKQE